jgi:hypothetical protein
MKKLSFTLVVLSLILISSIGCSNVNGSDLQNLKSSLTEKTLTILVGNNNGGSGEVDPEYGSHQYKAHQEVIVTATPSPGSLFVCWQGIDGVLSKMSAVDPSKPSSSLDYKIDVVMKQDVTLTALFSRARNLTINVNGPGTVRILKVQGLGGPDASMFTGDITQNSAASHVYFDGECITFSVVANPGAKFTGWTATNNISQIDPKYLPLPQGQPVEGSMMIPLDQLATSGTVYMGSDLTATANFSNN